MKGKGSKRILAVALSVAVTAVTGTASAIAAPPQSATFAVMERIDAGTGEFTYDGSILCESGTTTNEVLVTGFQSDRGLIFHVRKTITCDGSGTFTLQIQARLGFNGGFEATSGTWVVLRGTGEYAKLHGQGTVVGRQLGGGVVSDVYVGRLAIR